MGTHALFAPSSAATWLECSYSARNAVPEAPKPESTKAAADEGTRRHGLMEMVVTGDGWPAADDPAHGQATLALDFIRQLETGTLHTELKGALTPECGGTTDLFNEHPYIVTVLDYKFGKWDVDAYHNKQMLTYAAIQLERVPSAEWFRLVIYQPNGLDEGDPFKQWVAHRSEVEAHRLQVLRAIADRSPPKPGPQCRWCNAFQSCPAMTTDAGFLMGAMTRDPTTLTADETVRLLRIIRALGDVKAVYEDVLTTRLKMGYKADGAALKPGRSFRAWNDATQAAKVLYDTFGPQGVKPVSPAAAEKLGPAGKAYAVVGAHKPEAPLKATY